MVNADVFNLLREQYTAIPQMKAINLHYKIIVPDNRRRDFDNFIARCKPITDALVHAGVIEDDTPEYIKGFSAAFEYVKGKSATVIEIGVIDDSMLDCDL